MKKKRFCLWQLLLTAFAGAAAAVVICVLATFFWLGEDGRAILQGLQLVRQRFVGDYTAEQLVDGTMDGMIDGLGDRWSHYLTADAYENQKESRANAYVGIGCTIQYEEAGWKITRLISGGPAEQGGLQVGEIITAVDGTSVAGQDSATFSNLAKGEEGSSVELTVLSADGETRTVTLVRAKVNNDPVTYELLPNGVGLITIADFHARCAEEAIAAVDDLIGQGASALVFDVRNNPGGYVSELTKLLDRLMPEGAIFRSRSRDGKENVTESDAEMVDLPMAVLCNADSYSAAEFFAGALQENGQAMVVGEQTCGKGYSQQTFELPTGGAVVLSTAEYFTGAGTSFIGTGVVPNRVVGLDEDAAKQLAAGNLSHAADAQLQAALALLEP